MPLVGRVLGTLLFVWMLRETLGLSLSYNRLFLSPDARTRASRWIQDHIPEGSRIAVIQKPYWYSPPVLYNDYIFSGRSQYWRIQPRYRVMNLMYREGRINTEQPDYVVISDREIRMFQRSRGDFRKTDDWHHWDTFLRQNGYEKIETFENRLEKNGAKLQANFPPDDWQQILLEIRIYRRTALVNLLPIDYSKGPNHGITK